MGFGIGRHRIHCTRLGGIGGIPTHAEACGVASREALQPHRKQQDHDDCVSVHHPNFSSSPVQIG
jgi:hypothetical protein